MVFSRGISEGDVTLSLRVSVETAIQLKALCERFRMRPSDYVTGIISQEHSSTQWPDAPYGNEYTLKNQSIKW